MIDRRSFFVLAFDSVLLPMLAVTVSAQNVSSPHPDSKTVAQSGRAAALEIAGDVPHPLKLTAEEFARLPRQTVRAKGHDGVESQYEGVSLLELMTKAGVPTGKDLRGSAMAYYVVVEAADGYRAVFALAELDPGFTDRVILLADHRDKKPLAGNAAPLQVIVPGEKKHGRWVRQVLRLKVARG